MKATRWFLCFALIASLAACGFGLRPDANYPFKTLFSRVSPYSPLGAELRRQLPASGKLTYLTAPAKPTDAQVVLDVYDEKHTQTVTGVSAAGLTQEYQLRLSLKFRLRTPQGRDIIPETELLQQRTLSYNESLALAKEQEQTLLYESMRKELVLQIARRLAALEADVLTEEPIQ